MGAEKKPKTSDVDIFFPNQTEWNKANIFFKKKGSMCAWESENAKKFTYKYQKFDLVKKFFVSPEEMFKDFDFTVSMLAVNTKDFFHGEHTPIDLLLRDIIVNSLSNPIVTFKRVKKYQNKGFSIEPNEFSKIKEAAEVEAKTLGKSLNDILKSIDSLEYESMDDVHDLPGIGIQRVLETESLPTFDWDDI